MELRRQLRFRVFVLVATVAAFVTATFGVSAAPAHAAQTVPYKINFQGRLTDNNGNALSDGYYNVKFRLFDASTSGTNKWEADRVYGTSDYRVHVVSGLFNIQFGDTTLGDPALSPSLFNGASPLYLEVELPTPASSTCATNGCANFTEGAMTPRQPLASAAYAFNADTIDGLDSSALVQLSPSGQQSGSINVSGNIATTAALQGATAALSGANSLTLGSAGSATGSIVFQTSTAGNQTVTLSAGATTAGYALTLPTTAPTVSQCLKTDSSLATQLTFGSCGLTSVSLQTAYDGGSTITLGAGGTLKVRDASSPLGADLFAVTSNDGTVSYFGVSATGLKVYDSTNNANYASLIFSGGAAVLSSSTGVTQIGSASGNVNVNLSGAADHFTYTKTYTPTGAYNTDEFDLRRSVAGSANTLTGSVLKVEDLSTGSGVQSTILTLNQSNAAATGYLFEGRVAGTDKLSVDTLGNLYAAGSLSLGNTGNANQVTLSASSGSAGYTLNLPTSAGLTSKCLQTDSAVASQLVFGSCGGSSTTLQNAYDSSAAPAQILLSNAKDLVFTAPDTTTDSNVVMNFQCTTACSSGGGSLFVQHNGTNVFSVNQNTSASAAFLFHPTTDSTSTFQIQNSTNTALLTADTADTVVKIGTTATATLANVRLFVTLAEVSDTLRIGDSTNGFEISAASGPIYRGTARPTRRLGMSPEFEGAVIRPDGTSNTGTMSTAYDATNFHNYYRWTTTQATAQDYDVTVRVQIPMDFSALTATPQICFYGYSSNLSTGTLTLEMRDSANATVTLSSTSFTPGSVNAWAETCRTISGTPTWTPGSYLTLRMTMAAQSSSEVRLGEFRLDYLTKF